MIIRISLVYKIKEYVLPYSSIIFIEIIEYANLVNSMKVLWRLESFFTVLLIMINNPKSVSLSTLITQATSLNFTRSAQQKIQLITGVSVLMFLALTIFSTLHDN
uniref:Preprotein translocase SecG subunit n=1 Tax=Melanthalia intermedia TaxID=172989 RepID=A0A345UAT2_9FLOR|nr:Preprotein translocase SecG subunit [Melanthalia intermedia]AXI97568.1 Preprotein translocase SecG subunit [Melanthalia intermedia]